MTSPQERIRQCRVNETTRLDLVMNQPGSTLPNEVFSLQHLRHLSISGSGNRLRIPGEIAWLRHLERMEVRAAWLDDIPEGVMGLSNLKVGYFRHAD